MDKKVEQSLVDKKRRIIIHGAKISPWIKEMTNVVINKKKRLPLLPISVDLVHDLFIDNFNIMVISPFYTAL